MNRQAGIFHNRSCTRRRTRFSTPMCSLTHVNLSTCLLSWSSCDAKDKTCKQYTYSHQLQNTVGTVTSWQQEAKLKMNICKWVASNELNSCSYFVTRKTANKEQEVMPYRNHCISKTAALYCSCCYYPSTLFFLGHVNAHNCSKKQAPGDRMRS
jgi:hypothetical protein